MDPKTSALTPLTSLTSLLNKKQTVAFTLKYSKIKITLLIYLWFGGLNEHDKLHNGYSQPADIGEVTRLLGRKVVMGRI